MTKLGWNKGAVIAQACHASVAVMAKYKDDPDVQEYTSPENLEHMTKVVLKVFTWSLCMALSKFERQAKQSLMQ